MKYIIAKPHSIYELGKRANQEDNIYPKHGEATTNDSLFIVCDGMGGHESGEVASSTVCETMSNYINEHVDGYSFSEQDFQAALSATYDALDAKDNGAEKKMGTTMTFMKFHSGGCLMAHIGDSRMYHVRPSAEEKNLFTSVDHSLVNDLIAIGELTKEEAKTSRQKNIITRAIQPNQERRAKAAIKLITDIQVGDYFYICTDGMLEEMDDDNVVNILSMDNDDSEKIRILTELTVENKDNHSAYLIRIEAVQNEDSIIITNNTATEEIEAEKPIVLEEKHPQKIDEIAQRSTKSNLGSYIKFAICLILIFAVAFFAYRTFAKSDLNPEPSKDSAKTEQKVIKKSTEQDANITDSITTTTDSSDVTDDDLSDDNTSDTQTIEQVTTEAIESVSESQTEAAEIENQEVQGEIVED